MRALEVYLLTRRPISSWFADGRDPLTGFRPLKIVLTPPREALYKKLNARCGRMFDEGLVEEVKHILAMAGRVQRSLSSPWIQPGAADARRRDDAQEALIEACANTRRYAKRQITWFRKNPTRIGSKDSETSRTCSAPPSIM